MINFAKLSQFSIPATMPDYYVICQYDVVNAMWLVRFTASKQKIKTLYHLDDIFRGDKECVDWAKDNLSYNAAYSFKVLIESGLGHYN